MKTLRYFLSTALAIFMTASVQAETMVKAALDGYCPVCYIAAGKAVKGTEELKVEHKGQTYLFASADAVKAFKGNPEKFLPAYGGKCAFCLAMGKDHDSDPAVFMVHKGRIFLNANKDLEAKFKANLKENIAKADKNYKVAMKKAKMKKK